MSEKAIGKKLFGDHIRDSPCWPIAPDLDLEWKRIGWVRRCEWHRWARRLKLFKALHMTGLVRELSPESKKTMEKLADKLRPFVQDVMLDNWQKYIERLRGDDDQA